ncbi:MAG: hypothetical protein K0V04_39100 [Deltaproteobacteria bacterium]|nr:hypothetical protein [Deltaproteobacteria bacterium]
MAKQAQHPHAGAIPSTEAQPSSDARRGTCLAELVDFSAEGYPIIVLATPDEKTALEVPSTVPLSRDDVGATVLVAFVDERADRPIITGRVQPPLSPEPPAKVSPAEPRDTSPLAVHVEADGETLTLQADRELVLRCGKASLRLRRDGLVEVRGVDVVSRASRANWIRGGSVALN